MFKNKFLKGSGKIVISVICIVWILTGCTLFKEVQEEGKAQNIKEEESVEVQPAKGGELRIAIRKPTTLNPILSEDLSIQPLFYLLFDTLVSYDENYKPIPHLAESWSFDQEGKSLQIRLKDGIKWHDGTPFTAKDVVFTMDTIKKAPSSPYKKYIENISSYSMLDEKNIKIIYNQPFGGALYSLNFPILPAHYYEKGKVFDTEKNMHPIGTGPYTFVQFIPNQEIQLEANTEWFQGSPYIEKVKVLFTPDEETSFYAFEQRQINVVEMQYGDWQKYSSMENTKLYEYMIPYYDFIGFNFEMPKFQNNNVRKAIAYGIDRNALLEKYYLGHGVVTDTPLFPNAWFLPEKSLVYFYDKERGKQLLSEAGIMVQTESQQANFQFQLLVSNENPVRVQIAEEIKKMLKEIGMEVVVESVSSDIYLERLEKGEFEAFLGGWKLSPIVDFTFAFHSSQIPSVLPGGKNYIRYQDPALDQLLKETFRAVEENAVKQAYENLNQYLIEKVPYVSLYFQTSAIVVDNTFYGNIHPTMYSRFQDIHQWFIHSSYEKE